MRIDADDQVLVLRAKVAPGTLNDIRGVFLTHAGGQEGRFWHTCPEDDVDAVETPAPDLPRKNLSHRLVMASLRWRRTQGNRRARSAYGDLAAFFAELRAAIH